MALVEIARFQDVYEADLAAAFLASHGVEVTVTERFQTTIDPLMQRALGIRLMAPAAMAEAGRDLLARAQAREFASDEGDDLPPRSFVAGTAGVLMAAAAFAGGGFWGSSLPRRFRPFPWLGMGLSILLFSAGVGVIWIAAKLILDPP